MQYEKIFCKIFLAFYVLQVIFVMKLTALQNPHLMGVTIDLWRSSIGRFHAFSKSYYEGRSKLSPNFYTF